MSNPEWAERERRRGIAKNLALKLEVLGHYGGRCACCGEDNHIFLALDHVNDDGNVHRREIGRRQMYSWVKRNGYPTTFQVLCHNCNWAKRFGICPHKTRMEIAS